MPVKNGLSDARNLRTKDGNDGPALDPKVQEALGKALRAYSDDIVNAPIPDKFMALLAQLEASEKVAK